MTGRRLETIRSTNGRARALRLHLEEEPGEDTVRSEAAVPGVRVDFDAHGRAVALEIDLPAPPAPDRIDRVLEAVGSRTLDRDERSALLAAGSGNRADGEA